MPTRLLDRCNHDSIREFRTSATKRYNDGIALVAQGRRTAAIYLWGYATEMTLKAAYFSLIGLPENAPISVRPDIQQAIQTGRALGIAWPNQGSGHNIRAWAEFLVAYRNDRQLPYPTSFGLEVQRYGQRIGQLWRETLRYHKNVAYNYEVKQVREATEWFLVNSQAL